MNGSQYISGVKLKKLKAMNETILTYVINNIVIISLITVFSAALIYQAASEIKKVLTNK